MTLRDHPKMIWQKQPVWNPSSWSWMTTTIEAAGEASTEGIEQYGKLKSVRQFSEKAGAAIEILVGFEKAVFSAVIRLDDPAAIPDLCTVLDSLQGHSLKQIGDFQLARSTRILAKEPL